MRTQNIPKLQKRGVDTHKGTYGKVFIIAGSKGMMGAAYLTTLSCLRSGAGLVTLAIPETEQSIAATKLTCAMTYPLPATKDGTIAAVVDTKFLELVNKCDAVAIGPGMSQNKETFAFVQKIVPLIEKPLIIDADGLNAIVSCSDILKIRKAPTVITPHPGEFSRLCKKSIKEVKNNSNEHIAAFAKNTKTTIVLKVAPSIVGDEKQYFINTTGNPGMATGGSGDVLTGVITALLAQNFTPFEAAQLGVYIHGFAGDLACENKGEIGMIATDILSFLPHAFQKHLGQE